MNETERQQLIEIVEKKGYAAAAKMFNIPPKMAKRLANKYGVVSPVKSTKSQVLRYLNIAEKHKFGPDRIIKDLRNIYTGC